MFYKNHSSLFVSCSRSIISVGKERANYSTAKIEKVRLYWICPVRHFLSVILSVIPSKFGF